MTGRGSSFTTAMNVPEMITLKGTQLTETGTIEGISVGETMQGKSLEVTTAFTNTGNHHYYGAKNEIAVTDSTGKEVARTATTPLVTAIVPVGKVNFTQQIATSLSSGTYTVASSVFDNKGTVLDTKSTTFTLSEPRAAAPPTPIVSKAPTALTTFVTPGETPVTPGTIATRAPLSALTIMLALAAMSGILMQRRRN